MAGRTLTSPPRDPRAGPVCLLTREWAARRAESPDVFLAMVTSETSTSRGIEYRLPGTAAAWDRVEVFIREEGECCPFLAFEAFEQADDIHVRIIWPEDSNG